MKLSIVFVIALALVVACVNGAEQDLRAVLQQRLDQERFGKRFKKFGSKVVKGVQKTTKTIGNTVKTISKDPLQFVGFRCPKGGAKINDICSPTCKCSTFGPHQFPLFCNLVDAKCKRDHPCDFFSKKDAAIDTARIATEDKYARLFEEYEDLMASYKKGRSEGRVPKKAWLVRFGQLRKELKSTGRKAEKLLRAAKGTTCGKFVNGFQILRDIVEDLIEAIVEFIEEQKCFLVEAGFAALGTAGDLAFGVLTAGAAETREADPICVGLTAKKGNLFLSAGTTIETTDVVDIAFTAIQEMACTIRDDFGVDVKAIDLACERVDAVGTIATVLLNLYCGNPGSALAEILSAATQCAVGCDNGFCPDDDGDTKKPLEESTELFEKPSKVEIRPIRIGRPVLIDAESLDKIKAKQLALFRT